VTALQPGGAAEGLLRLQRAPEPAGARERGIAIAYAATGRGEVFSWGDTGFMASLFDKALPATERADLDRVALNVWQRFTR